MSYAAPGTFHHAINVSILAQKAARVLGADPLLVRVAAYYHDLGKLENPTLFIENQSGKEIPSTEDSDSIATMAQSIIEHVANGVKIAREYDFPEPIIELIEQHHGSTEVLYFYEKAKEQGLNVKRTEFRYKGPAPQTKEAIVLMLSDSVEAATRSIPVLTKSSIEEIVKNTISDKINEGQFDKLQLTKEEIYAIYESLAATLLSIYHQRISDNAEN
jgi:hypothetical protein